MCSIGRWGYPSHGVGDALRPHVQMPARRRSGLSVDVLQRPLPHVVEGKRHLPLDVPERIIGKKDPTRLALVLNTGSDVDAVAEDVIALNDDVTDVDADAEGDLLGCVGISLQHLRLNFHRTGHRVHGAGELDEHPIAGGLDDAALERRDGGVD